MKDFLRDASGIFTPEQVKEMQDLLDRDAVPGETAEQRTARAQAIIREEEMRIGLEEA